MKTIFHKGIWNPKLQANQVQSYRQAKDIVLYVYQQSIPLETCIQYKFMRELIHWPYIWTRRGFKIEFSLSASHIVISSTTRENLPNANYHIVVVVSEDVIGHNDLIALVRIGQTIGEIWARHFEIWTLFSAHGWRIAHWQGGMRARASLPSPRGREDRYGSPTRHDRRDGGQLNPSRRWTLLDGAP
jgi:hypothetical protein